VFQVVVCFGEHLFLMYQSSFRFRVPYPGRVGQSEQGVATGWIAQGSEFESW
jgi:hypothetical protein